MKKIKVIYIFLLIIFLGSFVVSCSSNKIDDANFDYVISDFKDNFIDPTKIDTIQIKYYFDENSDHPDFNDIDSSLFSSFFATNVNEFINANSKSAFTLIGTGKVSDKYIDGKLSSFSDNQANKIVNTINDNKSNFSGQKNYMSLLFMLYTINASVYFNINSVEPNPNDEGKYNAKVNFAISVVSVAKNNAYIAGNYEITDINVDLIPALNI